MGRLFWKFFFFIWLAQLTTVAGVSAIFWLKNHELGGRTTVDWSPSAGALVESAASTLHYAGTSALRGLLETTMHATIYAVDETGRDILGRPVTPLMLESARRMLDREPDRSAVKQVRTSDGHVYLLFSIVAHGHGPPGSPFPAASPSFPGRVPPHDPHRHFPIGPVVAGLFASFGFAALLAWYFSKPIRSLRSAFEAVSLGNLDVHLGSVMGKRRDELADLGHDFDRMVLRLRALMDGQRRLLHDVSHELRSPLARLQAAIGLLRQQPERLEDSLNRIEREGTRMDKLVGELLALSRLEAGVLKSVEEEIDIAELVDDIVADARFEAEPRGIAVDVNGDYAAVIKGSLELLHRAIENVVRNAVKHTPDGTRVTLDGGLDLKNGRLLLSVADEGPGVPPSELNSIFEPFFRGRKSKTGDGLGLAIARRVVETCGGSIRATNNRDGGLRVEILLPAHAATPPAALQ